MVGLWLWLWYGFEYFANSLDNLHIVYIAYVEIRLTAHFILRFTHMGQSQKNNVAAIGVRVEERSPQKQCYIIIHFMKT